MSSEAVTEDSPQGVVRSDWDDRKIFVSRIPSHFDDSSVKRLIEERVGKDSVVEVALVYEKQTNVADEQEPSVESERNDHKAETASDKELQHRGFAFVTLDSTEKRKEALELGTVRGGAKATSTKRHTLYLRPVLREEESIESNSQKQICFLWSSFRCPYGDDCKFAHEGDGGCIKKNELSSSRKQKCFAFKKGKCKAGDMCKFSHELGDVSRKASIVQVPNNEKDCINWKTKGKCRKGDKCPYQHKESVREAALAKLEQKKRKREGKDKKEKNRQPLSIRVFGLNYDTSKEDVEAYFEHCGPIVELTFPTFEDSGRSKGYCGVLFQSPKAVAKALELNGKELHGRWLSIQAGKMYLKQWEEQHETAQKKGQSEAAARESETEPAPVGEFGQKVKRRKKHGHSQ